MTDAIRRSKPDILEVLGLGERGIEDVIDIVLTPVRHGSRSRVVLERRPLDPNLL